MQSGSLKILRIDTRQDNVSQVLNQLRERLSPRGNIVSEAGKKKTMEVFGEPLSPEQVVQRICEDVRTKGTSAVLDYSQKLDRPDMTLDQLRVHADELAAAHQQADPAFLATIRTIRDNVLEFQQAILHANVQIQPKPGVRLTQRYVPLQRIGVCVPGGAAAYPSTVLMTVVPAQAAGVKEIAIVAPPTPFGANNPDLLATCHELGVTEVYRLGGAQAVAAMAYGIPELPAVDKIVGPGNLFVALAKKHVYGEVDIDSIAGPSEVVVIADQSTRADFTAADLLAQAEHSPGASILITWDADILERTYHQLETQVKQLSRCELTVASLESFGALILCRNAAEACELTDLIAPEHLHIATDNAAELGQRIRNAGATFLGNFSPVALGDYAAGPSHVLPTGGTARWAHGLCSNDFLR
ncbi:MAG: histidinol dehydrogenase, partial [Planctomycetales bacterium]|nr:histidinol dehydrogenase [Planctomycetales bacterium]